MTPVTLYVPGHPFAYEMECVVRLFFPGAKLPVEKELPVELPEDYILAARTGGGDLTVKARVRLQGFDREAEERLAAGTPDKEQERALALLLFGLLCDKTGTRPPWGILTGIRPVRLCRSMAERGMDEADIRRALVEDYRVTPQRADLALETGRVEKAILAKSHPKAFSLYISIPFCPTRCLYCSFVSHEIGKAMRLLPDYVECLCVEIKATGEIARRHGLALQTVYVGGGTPTTLEPADLDRILGAVAEHFDVKDLLEYTVEAGRPDTITAEKLAVLRRHGVDRISVNPQTMNDDILKSIGRDHTAQQIREGYGLAREMGFAAINMDLIAGLPGESPESFGATLDEVLQLSPANITVHTLTVKRSSRLRERDDAFDAGELDVAALVDLARLRLTGAGYRPYYLYRQKGTRQNLENVGYARPGYEGIYNVYIMEEAHTVLAVGAGAVTKLYRPPDTLQRVFNYKFPYEYIDRFDEMLRRKGAAGEFYERNQ